MLCRRSVPIAATAARVRQWRGRSPDFSFRPDECNVRRRIPAIDRQRPTMRTKVEFLSYEEVLNILAGLRFDVRELPAVANQEFAHQGIANGVFVQK